MANNLTALQPILFSVAQTVAAEPFGAIDAINTSFDSKGVARGDVVKVPVAPVVANEDFTPAASTTTGADRTASTVDVQITKSRKQTHHLTGEQLLSLSNGGNNGEWVRQTVGQMMRALRNEAEIDAVTAIKTGSSRAIGTAGTNPFGTNINAIADLRKVLRDNGAPMADPQLVFDTTSEAALLKLGIVAQADMSGGDTERRSGVLRQQYGFNMRQSAGLVTHTKGTGTGALINGAEAVGQTTLTIDTMTAGATGIVAGDVITYAADATNKYVVNTGLNAAAGDIVVGRPGLLIAAPDNNAITVGNSYTPILGFERSAVVGVLRPPVMPANPIISQMMISDQFGMTYLLLEIAQYGQTTWELHLAWGFKTVQSEFVATLMG